MNAEMLRGYRGLFGRHFEPVAVEQEWSADDVRRAERDVYCVGSSCVWILHASDGTHPLDPVYDGMRYRLIGLAPPHGAYVVEEIPYKPEHDLNAHLVTL